MTKGIVLLGSTGSIGTQALEACENLGIPVVALIARGSVDLLAEQVRRFRPKLAIVSDARNLPALRDAAGCTETRLEGGPEAVLEAMAHPAADTVLTSVVGTAGLAPTLAAIRAGKHIALANKETLVSAGELVMEEARRAGVDILPVDSEHSAIFQCLAGGHREQMAKILLTASGGPFRGYSAEALRSVTREQALRHPNWAMGEKITIDSASMMNKGLEVIEARWLFDASPEQIEVLVHPQSIIHSMVEFVDGSILAQLGAPDMRIPIQLALTWPDRLPNPFRRVGAAMLGTLTFEQPDLEAFRCLRLAYDALRTGGSMPCAMNAANEIAVEAFLADRIAFHCIPEVVERVMDGHAVVAHPLLEDIEDIDRRSRESAWSAVSAINGGPA